MLLSLARSIYRLTSCDLIDAGWRREALYPVEGGPPVPLAADVPPAPDVSRHWLSAPPADVTTALWNLRQLRLATVEPAGVESAVGPVSSSPRSVPAPPLCAGRPGGTG